MKNNKGFSLTEVVVTCGILAIIGGIGLANFGSYEDPTQKRELLQTAKVFSMRVKNCILNVSSMGGWKIKQADNSYMYPCKAMNNDELKDKLGWECPGDCVGHLGSDFYCMDIQKTKKGTKYQCIVHFNIEKQSEEIYCGTPENFATVSCANNPTTYTGLKVSKTKWQDEAGQAKRGEEQPEPGSTTTPNTGNQQPPQTPNTQRDPFKPPGNEDSTPRGGAL